MIVAQLSDTHLVAEGDTYFGHDTARYLGDAIDALHGLAETPDCVVVTGDLVNSRRPDQYARFRRVMERLRLPYFVIPGNHDDGDTMRAALEPHTYGGSRVGKTRYAIDDFAVRIVGLDANLSWPWPGAGLETETLAWLAARLESDARPTIVCVHQPPFRTGLHYLDAFGFRGARRLRAIIEANPHAGRVVSGHIHCVKRSVWATSLACTAPSTAPQFVPLICMDGKLLGVRSERPGFSLHAWTPASGFRTTVYRRTGDAYDPEQ